MEHSSKPPSQTLKSTLITGDVETDEEFTSDDVSLNYINQTPLTHLSVVRVSPPNKLKRKIGEKTLPSTRSPKLKIRIVK